MELRERKETKDSLRTQAWRATQKFHALLPMLTSFARALSGSTTRIEVVGRGCYSSGDVIYMAPPIGLGLDMKHLRSVCDRRDANLQHVCHACAQQEEILYKVFHEMGHQVYGTHNKLEFLAVARLREDAAKIWWDEFPIFARSFATRAANAIGKKQKIDCVMALANVIHPWLGLVLNAVEDVRVDNRTFNARPGLRVMAKAMNFSIMADGIQEIVDGEKEITFWRDRPLDMQVLIGLVNRGFGYELDEFITPEAVEVLDDSILSVFTQDMERSKDECMSFNLACNILFRLHQLGLCEPPTEDDEAEEEAEEFPPAIPSNSEQMKDLMPCSAGEGESSPEERIAGCGMSEEDAAIEKAVMQAQWFDCPSRNVNGVRINYFKDRHTTCAWYEFPGWNLRGHEVQATEWLPTETIIAKVLNKARIVFTNNMRSKQVRNLKGGRVSSKKLYRAGLEDNRLFEKKIRPDKRNYHFVIMADISGSNESGDRMDLLKKMLLGQGEFLHRLGVSFEMWAHSGRQADLDGTYTASDLLLDLFPIKEAHEKWGKESRFRVANLRPCAANLDGHAMEFARKRCDASTAKRKIIVYSSDGQMPAENYAEELQILQSELEICKKRNYIPSGVGIYTDSPTQHGLDTVLVRSAADIALIVPHIEKYLD